LRFLFYPCIKHKKKLITTNEGRKKNQTLATLQRRNLHIDEEKFSSTSLRLRHHGGGA
jgi:hypothetical protein